MNIESCWTRAALRHRPTTGDDREELSRRDQTVCHDEPMRESQLIHSRRITESTLALDAREAQHLYFKRGA
eukprot:4941793-Heterocapsa_arctica.AAC.1